MDTRLLEDALVLLEEKSFSAAAARRNVTQPAFSRRIRALEDWIGQELLVRGVNRIVISPSLSACEPQIRAMLAHLRQLHSQLKNFESSGETLVFACQHSLALSVFPEICQIIAAAQPDIVARLRTQNQDIATSIFLRHEADVLIGYEQRGQARMPFNDSISRHIWHRDTLIPIVGSGTSGELTETGRLPRDSRVIRYPKDTYFGQIINNHELGASARLEGRVAVESAFSMGISRLVLAGVGAGWVPHSIVYDDILAGNAVILAPEYGRVPLDIVLFVHRSNARIDKLLHDVLLTRASDQVISPRQKVSPADWASATLRQQPEKAAAPVA